MIPQRTPTQLQFIEEAKARKARIAARAYKKPCELANYMAEMKEAAPEGPQAVAAPIPEPVGISKIASEQFALAWRLMTTSEPGIVRRICFLVAAYYGVPALDLRSERRFKEIILPRQVAMYLASRTTLLSTPKIGRAMGGRDHTTVLHGVRKIERLIKTDEKLAGDVRILSEKIGRAA